MPSITCEKIIALRTAFPAMVIVMIAMGFGRFSFTAMYPIMLEEGQLSLELASLAASINYLGYLIGALCALKISLSDVKNTALCSVLCTILCLAMLGITDQLLMIRLLAGIFSALAMVSASIWLLDEIQFNAAPTFYSGVGVGIFLSTEIILCGQYFSLNSTYLCLIFAVISTGLLFIIIPMIIKTKKHEKNQLLVFNESSYINLTNTKILIFVYGLAGLGYIVTATYLPLLSKLYVPDWIQGHLWAIFGISAVPSCFIWHTFHQQFGTKITLFLNFSVQAFGVILPVMYPTTLGYLSSAIIVGATFMGTVTIVMPAVRYLKLTSHYNLMALMTISYGIGQILGPLIAQSVLDITMYLEGSLIIASSILILAALLCLKTTSSEYNF